MGITGNVQIVLDTKGLDRILAALEGEPVRILHDGVHYGVYQEFGTSRGVPPHPFMTPAVEHIRPAMEKGWKQVLEGSGGKAIDLVDKLARDAEAVAKANAPVKTGALRNSITVSTPEEFGAKMGNG